MSFLTDASLVFIPSGYKEDKAYSIKPTDGSGDLTFARASDGTRVNSDGLVERVPWNLLQYSEQFNQSNWAKFDSSATANAIAAPNGTTTADKFVEGTGSSIHRFIQGASIIAGQSYVFSLYAKAGERTRILVRTNNGSSDQDTYFDLSSGSVVSGTGTITDAGNGWYKISRTFTATTSTTSSFICQLLLVNTGTNTSYTGDGTSGLYIWGGQLNEGTLKPYFPTTNRQDVPRLDYSNGCPCLLLEPQRTNLVTYSEQFDNAVWSKGNLSVTANNTTSPDGTQNADELIESATTAAHYIDSSAASFTSGQSYTYSVYAKQGDRHITLQGSTTPTNSAFATFNLSTGVVGNSAVGTTSIFDAGNGWFRCSLTFTSPSTTTGLMTILMTNNPTSGRSYSYAGDGTSGVYVWGAQLEAGSYPTSYIPTTSASVTRIYEAIADKDIRSLSIGNSYTLMFDMTMAAQDNNKLFYNMRTSSAVDSFSVRNFTGGFRAYNNIDASYPFPSTTADNGKYILRVDGTTVDLFAVVSGASTKQTATISTARDFGYFYIDGSPTKINLFEHIIFDSALTDSQCEYLTGNSYSTYATMASQLNYTIQ